MPNTTRRQRPELQNSGYVSSLAGNPGSAPALTPGLALCRRRRHEGRVNCDIYTVPQWQDVGDDLDAAVILLKYFVGRGATLRPRTNTLVATVATASRQTLAAARSSGAPLARKIPGRGHAARGDPHLAMFAATVHGIRGSEGQREPEALQQQHLEV